MRLEIDSRFRTLDDFVARAESSALDERSRSEMARFGSVLICGNIERSVEIIILDRLQQRAHPRVMNFVKSFFKRGTNYDCAAIEQLLNRFDPSWYRNFCSFCEEHPSVREGISSCYALRNSVAHGGTGNLGLRRLKELLEASRTMIDALIRSTG